MKKQPPEIDGASVVVLGAFNPSLFHPLWFAKHKLLEDSDLDATSSSVVHENITSFALSGIDVQVQRNRFQLGTADISNYPRMHDLSARILKLLPETPVDALGINRELHFAMPDEEAWHNLGYTIVPKENWEKVFRESTHWGLRSVLVESVRWDDAKGHVRVKVEPSTQVEFGVYISVNSHYLLTTSPESGERGTADQVAKILDQDFDGCLRTALQIARAVLEVDSE